MTALTEFQRLEAQGAWRETPDAQLREVVVSVGDATLMLLDPKSERPLTHWSLPAVARLNPGKTPAIYSPSPDAADETVEIDDALMIQAIERVHRAIEASRAHPGRLRGGLTAVAIVAMLIAGVLWLPDALIRHAANIAPPAQARMVGQAVLADIERSTGAVCRRTSGQAVLNYMTPGLVGDGAAVVVVPGPLNGALRLPGNLYVAGSHILTGAAGPEVLAGHLLSTELAQTDRAVTRAALRHAGFRAALRLMTLGSLPSNAMAGYGEILLTDAPPRPDDTALLDAMRARNLTSEPYALSLDPTGAGVVALIDGDPVRHGVTPADLLTDPQWLALQQICAG
ncbi:hypothetical protein [Paracoccus sp. (in: a-proteobacteria)]|uniref:hypothetical protein n=1 Tax=Paracoccus sp. TaxID=267 RepID=UPI0026E09C5D|nr:hypothetical protein [Paracoccus sp. (in: a-proteobacteria)]MDO5646590.1 hypothetical protein [Paracoccus sp. (in: a-proteobacteria)]